jgi:hypothetical protein
MQIVVMKGWQGFADRLQLLSHLLNYCKKNNATICVDWRDKIWGQEVEDFSDYFEVIGIPTITIQEVVEKAKSGASIYPSTWTLEMLEKPSTIEAYDDKYKLLLTEKNAVFPGDILVTCSKGLRQWSSTILGDHLRFKQSIANEIISKLNVQRPYCLVHLRGTDRGVEGLFEMYVEGYENIQPDRKENTYIISDSPTYIRKWLELYPNSKMAIQNPPVLQLPDAGKGTHLIGSDDLASLGIKKHDLNINLLTDFMLYGFSNINVGFSESAFVIMGRLFSKSGVPKKWLGWEPN